jgi:hypothetical protein
VVVLVFVLVLVVVLVLDLGSSLVQAGSVFL